jgi:hypothetical protein
MPIESVPSNAPVLIPTLLRHKISSKFCYPVSAELLSNALAGVPQFKQLALWFCFDKRAPRPESLKALIEGGKPIRVLSVGLARYGCGVPAEVRWEVHVSPVPKELGETTRAGLMLTGIPAVRAWLEQDRHKTLRYWSGTFHVYLDPTDGALCSREMPYLH